MEAATVVDKLSAIPQGARMIAAAKQLDNVWLVGGAVRDLLLGVEPRELDVVVEGPIDELLDALGGECQRFERFGTATVTSEGDRFDVARARSESYARPGELPDVSPSTIEEDVARRDFTINAIAVRLADGSVRSNPRSLDDLAGGLLRVLHPGSFVDDPTRLWRCARYAARLGFEVEPETAALAAAALPGTVSGERLGHELRLALREPSPAALFTILEDLNAGALVEGFDARPGALNAALDLLGEQGSAQLTTLAACCAGVELDLLTRWLNFLQFSAEDRDCVLVASRWVTGEPLRNAQSRSAIAAAARGAPLEAVALAGGENARLWLSELRHVGLEITGDDLIAAGVEPGPTVGEALNHALVETLDQVIADRSEQLNTALEFANRSSQ